MIRWSANLAYVVGLIATDGSLSKDGRHIDFTSKDIDQIQTFARLLNLKNKIGLKSSGSQKEKIYHRIQFGDVKFYKFLSRIGLTPNKTKNLGGLLVPRVYFRDFLRGHLDGDGCVRSYWDPYWKNSFRLYLYFISASLPHLRWIKIKIRECYGLDGRISYTSRIYRLVYAKRASIKLIEKIYYNDSVICLTRKKYKIDHALGIIHRQAEVLELVDRLA